MNANEQTWLNRAALYELLALGFLRPEPATAEALASGELAEAAGEVLAALGAAADVRTSVAEELSAYAGADSDSVYHDILRDYTRLLVGEREPAVTPYAGVRVAQERGQAGLLFVGRESMAIERFMRGRGVAKDLSAGQSNDPVDHVGTVCEFLKYLCLVNARAVEPAAGTQVDEADFALFWRDLWGSYPSWCAGEVGRLAATGFYRAMALLLRAACEDARAVEATLLSPQELHA